MDERERARLQRILDGLFAMARQMQQQRGVERRDSARKRAEQVPHPLDLAVDAIALEFDLTNPGTDGHSLNCWPHPADGWPPETAERMRRQRVRMTLEKGVVGQDEAWLEQEGLTLGKSGWVRTDEGYGG
jgi:hypothetical protein